MPTLAERQTPTPGQRFLRFAARLEDGAILRTVFFAMLAGTIGVLALDYFELNEAAFDQPVYQPSETPVLPAVERPEADPANPAFAPQTELVTTPEILRQPLDIALKSGGVLAIPGAAERLATELEARGEYIETVSLNSPGGIVDEALAMGRLIRGAGLDTTVGQGMLCGSSCPLVLAGGVSRTAHDGAAIGVHQVYAVAVGPTISAAQSLSDAQSITAGIVRYLTEMDVDPALWVHALETPPDRLYYLTPEELAQYRLAGAANE